MRAGVAVTIFCFAAFWIFIACPGCSNSENLESPQRGWDDWINGFGTHYQTRILSIQATSPGSRKNPASMEIECTRFGEAFLAVRFLDNGAEYLRLLNPHYCCLLAKKAGGASFEVSNFAAANSVDYYILAKTAIDQDAFRSIVSGERAVEYARVSRPTCQKSGNELRIEFDESDLDKIGNLTFAGRMIPRLLVANLEANPETGAKWLNSWEVSLVTNIGSEPRQEVPLRRAEVIKWRSFDGFEGLIPSEIDYFTEETGKMEWFRNRVVKSVSRLKSSDKSMFYMKAYGVDEFGFYKQPNVLVWILVVLGLAGIFGYCIFGRSVRKS